MSRGDAAAADPVELPPAADSIAVNGMPIDQLVSRNPEAGWTRPAKLGRMARQGAARASRTRLRNAAAWFATLFIGGTIIVSATLIFNT